MFVKKRCKGKTNKGKKCPRKTKLLFCSHHWKRKLSSTKAKFLYFLGILSTILLLWEAYDKAKEVVYPKYDSESYWGCDQDRNPRGIFLNESDLKDSDSLRFIIGPLQHYQNNLDAGVTWRYSLDTLKELNQNICVVPYEIQPVIFPTTCSFQVRVDKVTGELLFSADLKNELGESIMIMKDNQFVLNTDCLFLYNRDDFGFEIVDSKNTVVFSVHYRPPNKIYLRGVFPDGDRVAVLGGDYLSKLDKNIDADRIDEQAKLILPLFEYTGEDWYTKRSEYWNW